MRQICFQIVMVCSILFLTAKLGCSPIKPQTESTPEVALQEPTSSDTHQADADAAPQESDHRPDTPVQDTISLPEQPDVAPDKSIASEPDAEPPQSEPQQPDEAQVSEPHADEQPDSGAPTDARAPDVQPSDGGPSSMFQQIYTTILVPKCGTSCHITSTNPAGDLAMPDVKTAYANLVNVPFKGTGTNNPCWKYRVEPLLSAQSAFYHYADGGECGPRHGAINLSNGNKLTAAEVALIKAWIDGGAK